MTTSPPPSRPGHPSPSGIPAQSSPDGGPDQDTPHPSAAHAPSPYAPADTPGALPSVAVPSVPLSPTGVVPGARHPHWWQRRTVRWTAVSTLLALCGLVILGLVREQTGTEGFFVGLGLAVLPVPLLVAAFRWLDRLAPAPWPYVVFCLAWGACAAALVAIVANSFATHWIADVTADPSGADALGSTVVAPVVEESSKAVAVLLVFLFRRRELSGLVDGAVLAGVSATGFAFTENILYLGTAFGDDQASGSSGLPALTAATFLVRVVMSPFAHPLFTVLSGIGFALAATAPERRRLRRALLPLGGLLLAVGMHAAWNAASALGGAGFVLVYAAFMVPAFALLTWLVVATRQRELRTVREELPGYAAAGWLPSYEAWALASLRARRVARRYASRTLGGRPAARTVAEYAAFATSLAFLRHRWRRGRAGHDFPAQEERLLRELWRRRHLACPALAHATRTLPPAAWPPGTYGWGPYWWELYGYGFPAGGATGGPLPGAPAPFPGGGHGPYPGHPGHPAHHGPPADPAGRPQPPYPAPYPAPSPAPPHGPGHLGP